MKVNYKRRAIGITACFSPVALLVVSAVANRGGPRQSALGVGILLVGILVAFLNLYLSVVRPTIYRWWHGSMVGYRHVSGLPVIGTLIIISGAIIGFGDWRAVALGAVALASDLGGLPWFLIATWRDRSLWDD